jgi:hypothetical protein
MTHLMVREYKPEDYLGIEFQSREQTVFAGQPKMEWAIEHEKTGPARTVEDLDGQVVLCIGIHDFWRGTGQVWALFSPLARKYLEVPKIVLAMMESVIIQCGYERLQAVVDPLWPEAVHFMEMVNFKKEADMRKYGPNGADMALYAWVKGE